MLLGNERCGSPNSSASTWKRAIDLSRLSFSQDVVYDYLLGIRATEYFSSNPRRFLHLLGIQPFSPDSATLPGVQLPPPQPGRRPVTADDRTRK
jgi:hypothetical protein